MISFFFHLSITFAVEDHSVVSVHMGIWFSILQKRKKKWINNPYIYSSCFSYVIFIFEEVYIYYKQDVIQGQFLCRVQLVWTQFAFFYTACLTMVKEPSLPYYLLITGGDVKTDGFMPLSRTLVWSETQSASFQILTWVANSISCDDNCYTLEVLDFILF